MSELLKLMLLEYPSYSFPSFINFFPSQRMRTHPNVHLALKVFKVRTLKAATADER